MHANSATLYLVRHGATDANLQRPYVLQGRGIDLSLNAVGRQQAEQAAGLLAQQSIAAVYASPMRRAVETAQAIAARCGVEVTLRDELVECDVGRWEGLNWDGIREQFPEAYENFQRDPSRFPYLGGETYSDVARRSVPVLEQLLEHHHGEEFVVVAHNVVNRVSVATFLGLELASRQGHSSIQLRRQRHPPRGRTDAIGDVELEFSSGKRRRAVTIRAVVYDLDGTLVDSGLDFPAIRREMALPEGVPILEALAEIPPGERLDDCLRVLDRHECEAAERATLMPGAAELVASLGARDIPQGIFTRNSRRCSTRMLERVGLEFRWVLCREDGPPKPHPAGLLKLCEIWRVDPADVLFVGDYLHDINAGRAAGVRTVLFAPGELPQYAPLADFCISSLAEIEALIDRLNPPDR